MLNTEQNKLLGAMIGLVRAADKNGKTENTDSVLLEGMRALRGERDLQEILQSVREEKRAVAPGCAMCAMPCGSTADADMDVVWQGDARSVALKKEILQQVFVLADCITAGDRDEQRIYHFHKGLFFIGEYVDPEELALVLEEIRTA